MEDTDKMVEIARFQYPAEAQTLIALLQSEGVDCYLRNEYSSQILAGYADIGGARVETLESNVPRALEIMKDGGYELPEEDLLASSTIDGTGSTFPGSKRLPFERKIILMIGLVILFLGLLIWLGSRF